MTIKVAPWDRSKQKYLILQRGNPWKVIAIATNKAIADFPAYNYDMKLIEAICFADNDDKIKEILTSLER